VRRPPFKIFHSKVLLFGEHIINKGATGLAIPFARYDGVFRFAKVPDAAADKSNRSLQRISEFIIQDDALCALYDTNKLLDDIESGLYFDSNIPQGYGLGSSGALVAAIYQHYRKPSRVKRAVTEIKKELGDLESCFHGKSSGLDPIVSYLNQPVLIKNGDVKEVALPKSNHPGLKLFLLNTHLERSTEPFVNLFLKKCENQRFLNVVEKSLKPANDSAIDSLLKSKYSPLLNAMKLISQLQFDMLPEFIPDKFKHVWLEGLKNNQFHLKLCGAGGGGFMLGCAKADADISLLLGAVDLVEILRF
jgi:mevalonate kinase